MKETGIELTDTYLIKMSSFDFSLTVKLDILNTPEIDKDAPN